MNGNMTGILLSVIAGLFGLINILFGMVLKAHKDSDDERWEGMNIEIRGLRKRFHDVANTIGKVDLWQRIHDEDIRDKK